MTLEVNRHEITLFVDTLFKHAAAQSFVSLRAVGGGGSKTVALPAADCARSSISTGDICENTTVVLPRHAPPAPYDATLTIIDTSNSQR